MMPFDKFTNDQIARLGESRTAEEREKELTETIEHALVAIDGYEARKKVAEHAIRKTLDLLTKHTFESEEAAWSALMLTDHLTRALDFINDLVAVEAPAALLPFVPPTLTLVQSPNSSKETP